jgi:hypothetical protein
LSSPAPGVRPQGESNADAAKKFAIEHKLDQDGMQNVYYFLNRKAAAAGTYKKELAEYKGFEYAGEITPIMIFEDTNAKGVAEFMAVKLNLVRICGQLHVSRHATVADTVPLLLTRLCACCARLLPPPPPPSQLAEASVALQRDIELFIISKVSLRMPVNLTDQGLGMQYVVVKRGETSDAAVQRFAASLKSDFGFTMSDKGIMEIKAGVNAKMAADLK